jgi:hypothetical protein
VREIVCHCEKSFEHDVPEEVDLDKNPEMRESILSGDFLSISCPHCGKTIKPEFPMRILQRSRELDIYMVPELDRGKLLRNALEDIPPCSRLVVGYTELVEKILLEDAALDDRAVEMLKYYLLSRAVESAETEEDIRILFKERQEDGLIFHIQGLRDDKIGLFKVAMDTYRKAEVKLGESLREPPFSTLLEPPYVSVNNIYKETPE